LGIKISERTVSNLMHRWDPKPPSQTWRTFLKNHMSSVVSIDFFTVPTATRFLHSFYCHLPDFFVHHVVSSNAVAGDRGLKSLRSSTN
jgi:hypothetical protein